MENQVDTIQPKLGNIGYSELALVHVTSYRPGVDKDGNTEIKSSFDSAGGFNQRPDPTIEDAKNTFGVGMRPTVHFTLQEPVTDHAYGSFEGREYTIYAPLKSAIEKNGAPEAVMSADTAFFAPESSVKLPSAVIVKLDTDKALTPESFAQQKEGMLVVAAELTDSNRADAIALLKSAEQRNPGLGAGEMAVYAETASGPRAAVEVSKALALNEINAPTLNKAADFKYEANLGFDGWSSHQNTQQFVRELPLSQNSIEQIHVGRHDGSLGDKLNSALRRGNHNEMAEVAASQKNPAISNFAEKINNSELMTRVRDAHILQELANKDTKVYDELGASSNGMARTIYSQERAFESVTLGTVTPHEADKALSRASDFQLDRITATLLERDVNGPAGNKGEQFLFDKVESARQMNAISKEYMTKDRGLVVSKEIYTVIMNSDNSKQQFGDAKSAADAFSKADAADKPSVVKTVQGKGANFLAGTTELKDGSGKNHSKWVGHEDKQFRDAWQKAEYISKEQVLDRDRAAGINSGMVRIDGLQAHEVRVTSHMKDNSQSFNVEFYKSTEMANGSAFSKSTDITQHQLVQIIGEKNADSVSQAGKQGKSPIILSGERLHYNYGETQNKTLTAEKESAPVDFSKLEKAEVGKTYRGPVMAVTADLIVQRHTDEKTGAQKDIAHNKENVFNYSEKPDNIGKNHQIAYPNSKSGFARELQPSEMLKVSAPQHENSKSAPSMERGK